MYVRIFGFQPGDLIILFGGAVLICILEILCFKFSTSGTYATRLTLETITHGCLGVLFWLSCAIFLGSTERRNWYLLVESSFWAAIFAVLPDVDHFICSGTLSLQAATKLPGRPFLHWMGFPLMFYVFLLILPLVSWPKNTSIFIETLGFLWIPTVAYFSHVLRDARHRGLWIWPPPDSRTWTSSPLGTNKYQSHKLETVPLPTFPIYVLALSALVTTFRYSVSQLNWRAGIFAPILRHFIGETQQSPPHPG